MSSVLPAFLALLPVGVVLTGLWRGWPAWRAALAGLAVALGVAGWQVWAGVDVPDAATLWAAWRRWWPVTLEVVGIIGGGLALSQCLQACGAQAALAGWVRQRAGQGVGAALLVVHGVTPFAESVTGFGIGVMAGIPLLRHMGLPPARAALLGLLGLCTVPWGSMGPGTLVAAGMAGLPFDALGLASAALSLPPFLLAGWGAAWLAGAGGWRWRDVAQASASALALWLAVLGANAWLGTAPAGAVGALAVLLLLLALRRGGWPPVPPLARWALWAYALVLCGVLAGRLPLWPAAWQRLLASPALWLWVAALCVAWAMRPARAMLNKSPRYGASCMGMGCKTQTAAIPCGIARICNAADRPRQGCAVREGLVQHCPRAQARVLAQRVARGWAAVGLVALAYVALGLVMGLFGMAARLAGALAQLGDAYALAAPFVAGLGGFVTGSNTAANAMLADTQARIALHLGAPLLPFMAAHNVGTALLMMASPAKVEMAAQLAAPAGESPETPTAQTRAWVQRMALLAAVPSLLALAVLNLVLLRG